MTSKRLIFTLLYDNGSFMLSRNFRLQKIGNLDWLEKNYGFANVGFHIDELIVLDVSRSKRNTEKFCEDLKRLTNNCFAPIAAGGGIRSIDHAQQLLRSGADKIVVNTALHDQPELVEELAYKFGNQCLVASIDAQKVNNSYQVYKQNGYIETSDSLEKCFLKCAGMPIGEIYLTSMDRDGTSNGLDFEMLDQVKHVNHLPLIFKGGVGNAEHIVAGLSDNRIDAVATAHLLNFVGDGLEKARRYTGARGVDLPIF